MRAAPVSTSRRAGDRALGLLLVSHPVPSGAYVVAVAALSWLAARSAHHDLAPGRLLLLLAAVACTQIATGAANDVQDFALDSDSRPEKPLVRGVITTREASTLAWLTTLAVLGFAAPLGLIPLLLCAIMEALGLAYDFGLKRTAFSALMFAAFFPILPLLAWSVFGTWKSYLPWIVPTLALLGVAMNISNSLPDLDEDIAHGVRGFPHRLGRRRSFVAAWSLPLCAVALMWTLSLSGVAPASTVGLLLATSAGIGSVAAAVLLFRRSEDKHSLRTSFHVQALGVLGIGGAWLAALAL